MSAIAGRHLTPDQLRADRARRVATAVEDIEAALTCLNDLRAGLAVHADATPGWVAEQIETAIIARATVGGIVNGLCMIREDNRALHHAETGEAP